MCHVLIHRAQRHGQRDSDAPRHRARRGGDSDAPLALCQTRRGGLDAPFGMMPGAEGFSLWHPASGNRDPAAQVQAQGSSGIEDQTSPLPVPALRSKGAYISLK